LDAPSQGSPINSLQLEEIADQIRHGRCVPFLGAAANITSTDGSYKGLPLGYQISERLAEKLQPKAADPRNLPRVSLLYERTVKRQALLKRVRRLLPDDQHTPSPLLRTLARLPFDLLITTNYDRLLEQALAEKSPVVVVQTVEGLEGKQEIEDWFNNFYNDKPPLVYKIHGTFREPRVPFDASPLIITEDDYIDFLTLLGSKEHGVPTKIASRLATSTLLFLGYSLEDWDFRAIYKVLVDSLPHPKLRPGSYSVQKSAPKFWVDFWKDKGVEILDVDVYEFAAALEKEFADLSPAKSDGHE
jgi:hypothetical protein